MKNSLELLNHSVISERYFFPRKGRPQSVREFVSFDGSRLCCSHSAPHPDAKTLVHFHGNGETVADYDDGYVDALAALGVNVLMVEYRGYGDSDGTPELGKMLQDVQSVIEQCQLAAKDTIVYGRSVGAIFAVEWARLQPKIAGLILESGVADPFQRLALRMTPEELGADEATLRQACEEHLNHQAKLAEFSEHLLVLHAAGDTLVTPAHAQAHMKYAAKAKKRLHLFPQGDHNTVLFSNWKNYLAELEGFFRELES